MSIHDGMILVTGASGRTGRRCIHHLTETGVNVRAFVRRAAAADELHTLGVQETFVGDLFDDKNLLQSLDGVTQVLHICPPMHPQEDVLARSLIRLARIAGVNRIVLWSVLHPHISVPHHERKLAAEAALIESGLQFTILQPARYMQHLESIWLQVRRERVHSFPFSTKALFSLVHVDDAAEAATITLTKSGHENAIYELAGPQALSQEDCADTIASVLRHEVTARAAALDDVIEKARLAGVPQWRIKTLEIMNQHYDVHGLTGNPNVTRWLLGRQPRSFKDYVEEVAKASSSA